MPGNGLGTLLEHGVEQFAEFVFSVLKWPDCIQLGNVIKKSSLSSLNCWVLDFNRLSKTATNGAGKPLFEV